MGLQMLREKSPFTCSYFILLSIPDNTHQLAYSYTIELQQKSTMEKREKWNKKCSIAEKGPHNKI